MKQFIIAMAIIFLMLNLTVNAEVYNGKELNLLTSPIHLGDQVIKEYASPKSQGSEFKCDIEINQPATTYIGIWVRGLLPKREKRVKAGYYQTKLIINDKEIAVLNNKISGKKATPKLHKLIFQVSGRILKKGNNTLIIKAGAHGGNYNDFEIQKIVISKTKPK